mmetsp:Transcript_23711/g.35123  ORF Transcript_23711/g.35123 Transcript_23711/m.35123 type:complete len:305 (-) Transcript_23711:140-1054(-)
MRSGQGLKVRTADADGNILVVRQDGTRSTHHRSKLRHRKQISLAYGGVSNDKCHDRHYQQEFTLLEEEIMQGVISENFRGDVGPSGKIMNEFQHSDNATQQFKSTGAIEFLTDQFVRRSDGSIYSCCFTKAFGCPGHGKGQWDRIGLDRWKGVVTAFNRQVMVRMSSDVGELLKTALDVYKYLCEHYDPDTWERKKDCKVSQFHIMYADTETQMLDEADPCKTTIRRPPNAEKFELSRAYQVIINSSPWVQGVWPSGSSLASVRNATLRSETVCRESWWSSTLKGVLVQQSIQQHITLKLHLVV